MYVNTKALTYTGLENMSDGKSSNKKTDHGLVFMFQSLLEKFSQPFAIFASSVTVSGEISKIN